MKKHLLIILAIGGTCACQPQETNEQDVDALVNEWNKANKEARQLSERLGTTLLAWDSQFGNDSIPAVESADCQSVGQSYKDMQISMQSFLDDWEAEAQEAEQLRDELDVEGWTEENENKIISMKLVIEEKEAEIKRWRFNLDSLQKICPTTHSDLPQK